MPLAKLLGLGLAFRGEGWVDLLRFGTHST